MKNFTLTLAGLFLLSTAAYAQNTSTRNNREQMSQTEMYSKPYLKHPTKKLKFHANPTLLAESIWKPKTEKIYNYEGTDGWVLDAERNYEYDIQGTYHIRFF